MRGPFLHCTLSAPYGPSPKLTGPTVKSLLLPESHNRKMATRVLTDDLIYLEVNHGRTSRGCGLEPVAL